MKLINPVTKNISLFINYNKIPVFVIRLTELQKLMNAM